jgi:hypothetical protein
MNKKKRTLLSALLFLLCSFPIFAQTNESEEKLFVLHWKADEYAWNYEVAVEKLESGRYTEILRQRTSDAEVKCALTLGRYRYQVTAYDFFGQPGGTSVWSYFEIIPGQVEIIVEEPEPIAEEPEPIIEEPEPPAEPEPLVEEPEPLVEEPEPVEVLPPASEPGNFFVKLAYAPLFSLPTTDFNRLYKVLPGSLSIHAGYIPFKVRIFSFGFELDPSWTYLSSKEDNYSVSAQLLDLHLGFVGQVWLPNGIMAINYRLGAGFSLLYNFHFEYEGQQNKDKITTWIPSLHAGVSFLWNFHRLLFLEAGVDLLHVFSVDNIPLEFIRPSLGVGLRF